MSFTHYISNSKGLIEIETMHAAHIDQAVARMKREGGPTDLIAHMEQVALRKHGEFLKSDRGAEWAAEEKNAEKHRALLKRLGWEG